MTSRRSTWHRDLGVRSFTRCRIAMHRALGRLSLKKEEPAPLSFPDGSTHALAQLAAEEIETLFAVEKLHFPRLIRM